MIVIMTVLVLVVVGWGNSGLIADSFGGFGDLITGRVSGAVNITVLQTTSYNVTFGDINWSYGRVTTGQDYAILATTNGTVENGNWTAVSQGFVVQNDGNIDLVFNISFGKVASSFLGGTSPEYQYNITNNETGSCTVAGGFTLDSWNEVSAGQIAVCSNLTFLDTSDEVRIDFLLKIPSDAYIDTRGDTLSVSVEAV